MTERPHPGFDVVALTVPEAGSLCFSLDHRRAGRQAAVVVTFGELGTRFRDDLWHESWHCSYPMCGDCWERTHRVARTSRPGLAVHDLARPQALARTHGRNHERTV